MISVLVQIPGPYGYRGSKFCNMLTWKWLQVYPFEPVWYPIGEGFQFGGKPEGAIGLFDHLLIEKELVGMPDGVAIIVVAMRLIFGIKGRFVPGPSHRGRRGFVSVLP